MTFVRGRGLLVLAVVAFGIGLMPMPNAAAVAAIVIDPVYGPPLTTIKVSGAGFCATCGSASVQVGSLFVENGVRVGSDGRFTTYVRIPGTARPGPVTVTASQPAATGSSITAETDFTVTINQPAPTTYPPPKSSAAPGGLPSTSAPTHSTPPASAPGTTPTHTATVSASGTTRPTATATSSQATTAPPSPSSDSSPSALSSSAASTSTQHHKSNAGVVWSLVAAAAAIAVAAALVARRRLRGRG